MAIYHLTVKVISRGKGQSAVASAAYRAGEKLFNERLRKHHNYLNKRNVVFSEIALPKNAPARFQSREILWNEVERCERREDAQLAREIEFALPIELTQEQAISLARNFIQEQFVSKGMIADWNVHWEEHNPHVHVMLSLREVNEHNFGRKVREWNKKELLQTWREQWTEYANSYLREYQHDVQIDHRSYKDQGIDLIPTIHLGKSVIEMNRRHIKSDLLKEANAIQQENLKRIVKRPESLLHQLSIEKNSFTWWALIQRISRYLPKQKDDQILSSETLNKIIYLLEKHQSVFSERDLAQALFPHVDKSELFTEALIKLKNSKYLIPLGLGEDGRERYTTHKMLKLESKILQLVNKLNDAHHHRISSRMIKEGLTSYELKTGKTLTDEQRKAVQHLTGNKAISSVVGRAGTGKSFTLGAAKTIWEMTGLQVQGIALSGVAADNLTKESNVPSRTIESFRYALQEGIIQLNSNDVVVMDEAGMTDNNAMLFVIEAIQKVGAKLCLIGDPAQLQPIGIGAIFRVLLERVGFVELQTVYRQKEAWQRDATVAFSLGKINEGLDAYQQHNCIYLEDTEKSAMDRLIQDWQNMCQRKGKSFDSFIISAHRNQDVTLLNQYARNLLQAEGKLKNEVTISTSKGDLVLSNNERILFLKNDRSLRIRNGRFATIVSIKENKLEKAFNITVKLDGDKNKTITFSSKDYAHFTYGYAATVYKLQGCTKDHTFNYLGGNRWNRNLLYVAATRHRKTCYFYADKTNYRNYEHLQKSFARSGLKENISDFILSKKPIKNKEQQKILNHLLQLEKNVKKAEQQPYLYLKTVAKEAFEKYVLQISKNKTILKYLEKAAPKIMKTIEQFQDREL